MTVLVVYAALSLSGTAVMARWFHLAKQRGQAKERHPAGGCDGWTPPLDTYYPFRARPCRHLLYTASLDEVEMEHLELLHVDMCPIAQELLPHRKGEAA